MFTIDFTKPFLYKDVIYFNQGNLAINNILRCKLATGGDETLEGYIATVTFKTLSHPEINGTVNIVDAKNCIVDIKFPSNALEVGVNELEVILTKGEGIDKVVTPSPIIKYEVWQCITTGNGIQGDSNYPILIDLISDVNNAVRIANNASATADASLKQAAKMLGVVNDNIAKANIAIDNTNSAKDEALNAVDEVNSAKDNLVSEVNAAKNSMIEDVNSAKESVLSDISATKQNVIADTNKAIKKMNNDFEALTASQQQDAEVILARDGEKSLNARLERDLVKGKIIYETVEDSYINTNDTLDSYLQNVEIKGNTVQNPNDLSDIKSVGDKVGEQELYRIPIVCTGKNILDDTKPIVGYLDGATGTFKKNANTRCVIAKVDANTTYALSTPTAIDIGYNRNQIGLLDSYPKENIPWYQPVEGGRLSSSKKVFTTGSNTKYVAFYYTNDINVAGANFKAQLEKETQATPYEPYQEHKITILSPTQLDKGDIIKEVNEVWGVEKNNSKIYFDTDNVNKIVAGVPTDNTFSFKLPLNNVLSESSNKYSFSNIVPQGVENDWQQDKEQTYTSSTGVHVQILKSKLPSQDFNGVKKFLVDNNAYVIYRTKAPTFIPLPNSQQVKLRTFASQTNISFLTEIEGTIKADVSKSLGATVNSNTQAIQDLNKDLERVKRLEEATTTTVTTESSFAIVEETSNGYFEDVKLEGRTDINLSPKFEINYQAQTDYDGYNAIGQANANSAVANKGYVIQDLEPDTEYTIICNVITCGDSGIYYLNNPNNNSVFDESVVIISGYKGIFVKKLKSKKTFDSNTGVAIRCQNYNCRGQVAIKDFMILKGDHTQNPPSYFEGMKSVGDDVNEIVVSSYNKNLAYDVLYPVANEYITSCRAKSHLLPNTDYNLSIVIPNGETFVTGTSVFTRRIAIVGDGTRKDVNVTTKSKITPDSLGYYNIFFNEGGKTSSGNAYGLQIERGDKFTGYTLPKQDKKKVLYYDTETQTWKKPILREWDSIEKHNNGKYYYHKRSSERLFNGSEEWYYQPIPSHVKTVRFSHILRAIDNSECICDKFTYKFSDEDFEHVKIGSPEGRFFIYLDKTKIPSIDVNSFKTWLQQNPITVVYQLEQEKVYECTAIDLITFENETNYSNNCGAITPKTTLRCTNYIGNVINTLKEKVSNLENKLYNTNLANFAVALNTLDTKLKLEQLTKTPR